MSVQLHADGSAETDAHPTVTIDAANSAQCWRYSCPNGHRGRSLEPTNGGIWCRSCSRDHDIEDPHHHVIIDCKTGEKIPWSAVEIVDSRP